MTTTYVWAVHKVMPGQVCAHTDEIFTTEEQACEHAMWSSRWCPLSPAAVCVTRFVLDQMGTRTPTALFVGGVRQQVPHISDDRTVHCGTSERHGLRRPPLMSHDNGRVGGVPGCDADHGPVSLEGKPTCLDPSGAGADLAAEVFTELVWWLATRSDLPVLLAEHTKDAAGQCLGCAGYGMPRRWPCGVRHTLHTARALQTSPLFTTVTGRPRTADPLDGQRG